MVIVKNLGQVFAIEKYNFATFDKNSNFINGC
jgi:hypothetical protein